MIIVDLDADVFGMIVKRIENASDTIALLTTCRHLWNSVRVSMRELALKKINSIPPSFFPKRFLTPPFRCMHIDCPNSMLTHISWEGTCTLARTPPYCAQHMPGGLTDGWDMLC